MPKTVATKPYDWTYTTTYIGHQEIASEYPTSAASSQVLWRPADPEEPSNAIPMAELSRPDPILFYAEIPLFEDELHDNGSSSLLVRIVRESTMIMNFPDTEILACNARLLLHFISVHVARRSCPVQDARYSYLPFICVRPAAVGERSRWLGSTVRTHPEGRECFQHHPIFWFTILAASSQTRRYDAFDRSDIYRQDIDGIAQARITERRRKDWLAGNGFQDRSCHP